MAMWHGVIVITKDKGFLYNKEVHQTTNTSLYVYVRVPLTSENRIALLEPWYFNLEQSLKIISKELKTTSFKK